VFAEFHGGEGDGGVHVVGSGDEDGVNVLLAIEHLAIVGVASGFRKVYGLQTDHGVEAGLGSCRIERRIGVAGLRSGRKLDALSDSRPLPDWKRFILLFYFA